IEDKLKARNIVGNTLLDCPLSGTGAQARTKDLVVYASGDQKAFKSARKILDGFSRAHYYLGEFGNGSKMKFVANLLVAIYTAAMAQGFAKQDTAAVCAVLEAMANASRRDRSSRRSSAPGR